MGCRAHFCFLPLVIIAKNGLDLKGRRTACRRHSWRGAEDATTLEPRRLIDAWVILGRSPPFTGTARRIAGADSMRQRFIYLGALSGGMIAACLVLAGCGAGDAGQNAQVLKPPRNPARRRRRAAASPRAVPRSAVSPGARDGSGRGRCRATIAGHPPPRRRLLPPTARSTCASSARRPRSSACRSSFRRRSTSSAARHRRWGRANTSAKSVVAEEARSTPPPASRLPSRSKPSTTSA